MMRMTVLASGSKGNSTLVSSSRTRILVDAGLSCREFFKRMQLAGEDPRTLDAILVTHEHQDHVQGLALTARKLGVPVFFTAPTHRAWMRWMMPQKRITYAAWLAKRTEGLKVQALESQGRAGAVKTPAVIEEAVLDKDRRPESGPGRAAITHEMEARFNAGAAGALSSSFDAGLPDCEEDEEFTATKPPADPCALPGLEFFEPGVAFSIGDIEINPFTIPHDAADPVGFVFRAEGIKIGLATDLGYLPSNVKEHLRGCDVLMIESNHDLEMLRDGPYPWSVKQRVMSRVGHLSNDATADFLEKNYDGGATYVVLAHLSESNNLPELARVAAERALEDRMNLLCNKLVLADQRVPTAAITL
ncbi:MAG TPA: MBL fold metallo-hydrolase [Acidisarcina sp.]